jgi:hypothetical protein
MAVIDTSELLEAEAFKTALNQNLPDGIAVNQAMNVFIPSGGKKHSLSSLLWGFVYSGKDGEPELVKAKEEKPYRQSRLGKDGNPYGLERLSVLAKAIYETDKNEDSPGSSYFEVYRWLYPDSAF